MCSHPSQLLCNASLLYSTRSGAGRPAVSIQSPTYDGSACCLLYESNTYSLKVTVESRDRAACVALITPCSFGVIATTSTCTFISKCSSLFQLSHKIWDMHVSVQRYACACRGGTEQEHLQHLEKNSTPKLVIGEAIILF